jgi:hypothetical protein
MKRLTAGVGVAGLGLMGAAALAACRVTTPQLETLMLLFLAGVVLFVAGGSGYSSLQR